MHFHKYPYSSNFEFVSAIRPNRTFRTANGSYRFEAKAGSEDIYFLKVTGKNWEKNDAQTRLLSGRLSEKLSGRHTTLNYSKSGKLRLATVEGKTLLESSQKSFFGQCGEASIFEFQKKPEDYFYGMGEKWTGLEHSGKLHKFWNTDIWADFHPSSFIDGNPTDPDPTYVSIPYLILKRDEQYIGLFLDNPHSTFISTGAKQSIAGQMDLSQTDQTIRLGAEKGQPNLVILYGPSLAELTRKFQKLTGTTPLPPAWSLGYHQCRWGYQSEKDLLSLEKNFEKHRIPVDGLWLDIDYMRGFRVFTYDPKHFPNPPKALKHFKNTGHKVIPIIDPGVKKEKGYDIYKRGLREKAFCLNPQKQEYIGLVWPGETVFPDFSTPKASKWWAGEVADFASEGIYGAWLDMNEPSTGNAENEQMLFANGKKDHSSFHNQYALGMARATREGFLQAHPDRRPFLLSRSGCTGSQRYAAIWTGDNFSNYHHLKGCIATTLNLALSGIPFNAPDAGGFGGDAYPELIRDWFKACFLFPVLRNHTIINSRPQEPWAFDNKTLRILRRYICLRYRLRPYLYQLFIGQEETGDAILRPLFYDFKSTKQQPLEEIDDQFMVGPSLLQAPFVEENLRTRKVTLPTGADWLDIATGKWRKGGTFASVRASEIDTPLYLRSNSILPLARLGEKDHQFKPAEIDFHIFLRSGNSTTSVYHFDDGESFDYQKGKRSTVEVRATRKGTTIRVDFEYQKKGHGEGRFTFTTENSIKRVFINGNPAKPANSQGESLMGGLQTWSL